MMKRLVKKSSRRGSASEVVKYKYGQLKRWYDGQGRLIRLELLSPSGKTRRITARFDWDELSGERRANGRNVNSMFEYSGGAEHLYTTWDDDSDNPGTPIPFKNWVDKITAEFEERALTGTLAIKK